mmetsp:Transcript_20704/g.31873  ORF Transcript_20704/g.31873 Transcript_20704/m.31873 type:complete len:709 (-) Transcript_20704:168-2294(-)|eukprot:CAMPEP_0195289754 /NCGR_PEP_ID=MMETSP0707-20130614/5897_1 /TAXON_ID=33640 /ORGANISM="Asterionellopsis glacialis, Strain CCMP134" /LENGTH=708 /DNA_ID=CAMNT_0040349795 /DNA_START=764 /DNA_END=2890 /DNA_ORIENTATION=+
MDLLPTTTTSYYGDTISRPLQASDDIAPLISDSLEGIPIVRTSPQSASCCSPEEESFVEDENSSLRATDPRAHDSRGVTRMSPADTFRADGFGKSFGGCERRCSINTTTPTMDANTGNSDPKADSFSRSHNLHINTRITETSPGCESTIKPMTTLMKHNNDRIDGTADQEELTVVLHDSIQQQQQQHIRREVSCGEEEIMEQGLSKIPSDASTVKDTPKIQTPKLRTKNQNSGRPRLTLSAFRRPEHTVRITDADPSRSLSDEYDVHSSQCRILGHGGAATVRLAVRRRDGVKVAVKSIAKHDALRARRLRRGGRRHLDEWEILKTMNDHASIVSLEDLFESDDDIHVVMEYCSGGELFDAIQKKRRQSYTESQAACITSQMLSALSDLHTRGIIHRDVKPENILLLNEDDSNIHVKLADFGVARVLVPHTDGSDSDTSTSDGEASPLTPPSKRSRAYSCVGTDYYAAPEVCAGEGYDTAVDVYSLGVSLYVLLSGVPPAYATGSGSETDEDDDDLTGVVFPSCHWKSISQKAKQLIRRMLHPDPEKRITASEALQDEWILDHSNKSAETSTITALPHTSSSTSLDLDLLRSTLYKTADTKKRGSSSTKSRSKKKRKVDRKSNNNNNNMSSLVVMADLHRVVASVATSASAAAAGVMLDEFDEGVVRVVTETTSAPTTPTTTTIGNIMAEQDGKDATQFGSSLLTLSV